MNSSGYAKYSYQPITHKSEYINLEYHFNYSTLYAVITFLWCIPPIHMHYKMIVFYGKNKFKIIQNGLNTQLYKSFIIMQTSCLVYTISDFLIARIPATTIVTPICANYGLSMVCSYIVAFFYISYSCAQLYTLQFSILRVIIVFSWQSERLCSFIMSISSPLIITFSFLKNASMFFQNGFCMQLGPPYAFGSVLAVSTAVYGTNISAYYYLIFSTVITILITAFNMTIIMKSKRRSNNFSKMVSKRRRKSESILTITMLLILIPIIITFLTLLMNILKSYYYAYGVLLRPIIIDSRLNIVTIYFYLKHPVFKKQENPTSFVSTVRK